MRLSVPDLLKEAGVPFYSAGEHHHAREGWLALDCPFCGKDSGKYHLGYSLEKNFFNCWSCGGHRLFATLSELTGRPYGELQPVLGTYERFDAVVAPTSRRGTLLLPRGLKPLAKPHLQYLLDRGLTLEDLFRWKLQGLDIGAFIKTAERKINLSWRVFIPIQLEGITVSWTTRAINPKVGLRYISAPAEAEVVNHKELLFGEDFARHAVCCVEGPFDAMRIGPGAVATCGIAFSDAQVARLISYNVRAVCFDNEPRAQQRAQKLIDELSFFPGKTYNIVLDAKDPGSASEKELRQLRRLLHLTA